MPKKGKGKKKGKKKGGKKKLVGNELPEKVVQRFLKTYERNCGLTGSLICTRLRSALKHAIEKETLLSNFVIESLPVESAEDPVVSLEPLVAALRQERYTFIKDLHIWELPITYEHMAILALLLEKRAYPFRLLEFIDCLISPLSVKRISWAFQCCATLTHIVFDYNEFGDEGCKNLCLGLEGNTTVLSISLCYCCLCTESGATLGHIASTTAISELYLDGNDLECEGVVELIKFVVDQAEEEAYQRAEEERLKIEQAELHALRESESDAPLPMELEGTDFQKKPGSGKKKKRGKRKKKSKVPPPPPPVGPWINKLHLADNGIDCYGGGGSFAPLICMRLFRRLISASKCLQELDLEDNLIGDLAGKELVEALLDRKEVKLPSMKLRSTHRMNSDTFNNLIKLGSGLAKKKKKRGKKKKK